MSASHRIAFALGVGRKVVKLGPGLRRMGWFFMFIAWIFHFLWERTTGRLSITGHPGQPGHQTARLDYLSLLSGEDWMIDVGRLS